ncbi:MAG: hypothetical protein ACM3NH_00370 [Candidatus Saccharibacteria bacterium]
MLTEFFFRFLFWETVRFWPERGRKPPFRKIRLMAIVGAALLVSFIVFLPAGAVVLIKSASPAPLAVLYLYSLVMIALLYSWIYTRVREFDRLARRVMDVLGMKDDINQLIIFYDMYRDVLVHAHLRGLALAALGKEEACDQKQAEDRYKQAYADLLAIGLISDLGYDTYIDHDKYLRLIFPKPLLPQR